jgi:hypothetical protein
MKDFLSKRFVFERSSQPILRSLIMTGVLLFAGILFAQVDGPSCKTCHDSGYPSGTASSLNAAVYRANSNAHGTPISLAQPTLSRVIAHLREGYRYDNLRLQSPLRALMVAKEVRDNDKCKYGTRNHNQREQPALYSKADEAEDRSWSPWVFRMMARAK